MSKLVRITIEADVRIADDVQIYVAPSDNPSGLLCASGHIIRPWLKFELGETVEGEGDEEYVDLDCAEEGQRGIEALDYTTQVVEVLD